MPLYQILGIFNYLNNQSDSIEKLFGFSNNLIELNLSELFLSENIFNLLREHI